MLYCRGAGPDGGVPPPLFQLVHESCHCPGGVWHTNIHKAMFNDLASRIGDYRLSEWGASILSATLFLLILPVLYGQGTTGTIFGTIIDKSGAVIVEAVFAKIDHEIAAASRLETNNDITVRKRAEQALRRREAYLADAQSLAHTGSWDYDGTTRKIFYLSEETFRLWGFAIG
jgi:PAS domain-containing protein